MACPDSFVLHADECTYCFWDLPTSSAGVCPTGHPLLLARLRSLNPWDAFWTWPIVGHLESAQTRSVLADGGVVTFRLL
jgi:hypothetical protein